MSGNSNEMAPAQDELDEDAVHLESVSPEQLRSYQIIGLTERSRTISRAIQQIDADPADTDMGRDLLAMQRAMLVSSLQSNNRMLLELGTQNVALAN